ncbi:ATPase [Chryseobacterium sp. G0240]|uniref:AAA family ATPase n=1 Tax=Chryseobacterium sp. G0240 TaxID=2487066 RepID=UPI000F45C060|nr:AAA family ATPase [Chryseobacterium sp. G0240]ROI04992.1 ATPase [Chryseobacterium sp. G0240]
MESKNASNLYIITGGPGAGKTSLLNQLSQYGVITASEEGRRIIKEQIIIDSDGVPWKNKRLFADLMFEASVKTYQKMRAIQVPGPVFFDRGILDTIGYLITENIPVSEEMKKIAHEMKYHKNVFVLPPWKEIYENDPERKQTWNEAVQTFETMRKVYTAYGYNIIEVPQGTIEQRALFLLDCIEH